MKESDEKFREFQETMKPAVVWLQRNGNPHQKIIIEMNGAELVSGEIGFQVNETD